MVQYDIVSPRVSSLNLCLRASLIERFDLDSARTGAFGTKIDVV